MTKILISLLFTLALSSQILRRQVQPEETYTLNQDQYWFSQIVDHFNYQNSKTWSQRYYVFSDYFNPSTGPIILYICGQAPCRGISDQSFTAKIAQQTQGLVLSLEHRYYGQSMPLGQPSLSFANLKYLTAEQALKDLAYFLTMMSKSGKYKITPKNPWITVGGSYPGALSAWFRNKYPHLTIGAISSSGVVLAVEDFRMYDEQVYLSASKSGDFCVNAILEVDKYVETQVTGEFKQVFKAQFDATQLTAREFLFYWADVTASQIQYGNRSNFCNSLKDKTLQERFSIMKELALKIKVVDYGAVYLKNESFALADSRGARSWMYQSCTQFSYFQTYAKDHPMRSRMVSIDFYRKWCDDIFGQDTWPFVDRVNNQFGGLNLNTNNLIMTNGEEDPWQWASVQKSKKTDIYAKVINCQNCAHCVDLHAPNKNDAKDLITTRTYQEETIKKWISEHWKNIKN